ncbi:MAG TPA: HEAT repeat domain-containing protein [Thermodesulfobacteriota bacterium]|nr:HEAT repeat domain-containing protein [Thermodesulfobacteriota bacterium]
MAEEVSPDKKVLDLSGEMPPVEGAETDEEILLSRDLTGALVKTVKAFRFYPSDNPTLKGLRDQLLRKFQYFLNKYQSFVIQVGQYDLSYKGKILYEDRDMKTSLALSFYKDGLKEIQFLKQLEEWEVEGILDILKQSEQINSFEEDIVTMMWERDFVHIRYLATDEFLEETAVFLPDSVDQFRKNLVSKPLAHHVEIGPGGEGSETGADWSEGLSKVTEELSPFVSDPRIYSLTPDEAEGLRREVEAEVDRGFPHNTTDILFEILVLETEQEPYQDAVRTLVKVLDGFLTLSQFVQATDLLKRVHLFLKSDGLQSWQVEKIGQILLEAGEEARVAGIGKVLEREEVRLEEVNAYLSLLQKNSIQPLVNLLGELKNSKARRLFCDALAEIGKDSIELLIPFMEDRRWFLVRNIVYILGRIGKEESLPYIQKAFNHQENRVRREAIQALGLIGGQKTVGLLVRALTDDDVRIRCMAAINLGKTGKKAGLIPLIEIVQSKDFYKREPVEIRAFFNGIGMAGSDEAVSVLRDLLERKSWFGRGKADETRIGAAHALAMIGTPDAIAILEEGEDSKDETLRDACTQALRSRPA